MRVLFLQNFWHEHIGTMCLASVLKNAGHEVRVAIGRDFRNIEDSFRAFAPDAACFSCTTGEHLWALDTAAALKKISSIPVIFGGPHPTYMPQVIEEPCVDYACVGEGEAAIVELFARLRDGADASNVPNILAKKRGTVVNNPVRSLVENLDSLPFPDRGIYYDRFRFIGKNPVKHFMAGRGCIFDCSYCYNHLWMDLYKDKGHVLRYHSPDYCIDEILETKRRYVLGTVVFEDDTFTANKKWLFEFLDKYAAKVAVPFACNVHAATVTEEAALALAKAGCFRVNMGLESGNERLRQMVLNKRVTDEQIIRAAQYLKKHKIKILTNNMLGLPGETLKEALDTVKLNIKIKTDYPWCSLLQPYPNTRIEEYARKCSKIRSFGATGFQGTFFEESVLDQPEIREIVNLQKLFYIAVKAPMLLPLIRRLIHLPLRRFYNMLFLSTFAYRYMKCHRMTPVQMLVFSLRNSRLYGESRCGEEAGV